MRGRKTPKRYLNSKHRKQPYSLTYRHPSFFTQTKQKLHNPYAQQLHSSCISPAQKQNTYSKIQLCLGGKDLPCECHSITAWIRTLEIAMHENSLQSGGDIDQIEQSNRVAVPSTLQNMLLILFSLTVHTKKCRQVSLKKYSYISFSVLSIWMVFVVFGKNPFG